MRKRRLRTRWLSLLLALALTLGMVTLPASAEDQTQEEVTESTEASSEEEDSSEEVNVEFSEEASAEAESAETEAEEADEAETEVTETESAETNIAENESEETETEETVEAGIDVTVTEAAAAAEKEDDEESEEEETESGSGSDYVSTWYENGLAQGLYVNPDLDYTVGWKFQNETISNILNMSQDPELEGWTFSSFFAGTMFTSLTYETLAEYAAWGYEDMNDILGFMPATMSLDSSYILTLSYSSVTSFWMEAYNSYHGQLYYMKLGDQVAYCLDYGYQASTGTLYEQTTVSSKLTNTQQEYIKTGILFTLLMYNGDGDLSEGYEQGTMSDFDWTDDAIYYTMLQVWIWGVMVGQTPLECASDILEVWTDWGYEEEGQEIYDTAVEFIENDYAEYYDLDSFELAVYTSGNEANQMMMVYDFDTLELVEHGQISLTKSGTYTSEANLKGAEYTVYSDADCTDSVAVITTDKSGYGISDEFVLEDGVKTYYVKETKAPSGTKLNSTVYSVSRSDLAGNVVNLNDLYGDIQNDEYHGIFYLTKTDSVSGEALPGAVFAVYTGDDYETFLGYLTDNGDGTYTSDDYYYTTENEGKFLITEVSAPDGYENTGWSVEVTLEEDTEEYSYTVVNNASTGGVSIQKVDAETVTAAAQGDATLAGAVYVIVDAETGEEVTRITTDETGYAATGSDELSFGNYVLYEVNASTGYTVDETRISFTVDTAHTITALTNDAGEEAVSEEQVIRGGVLIQKSDYQTGTAVLLAGTEFTIYNSSDAAVLIDGVSYEPGEAVMVLTTDGTGMAATDSDALPYGTYTVVETKAPTGYTLSGITTLTFSIVTDGELVELTGTNGILDIMIRGDFELNKKDFETQEEMAGVSFLITSDSTGESHVITTDENGYYSSSSDYVLHSYNTNAGTAGSGLWFGYDSSGNWAEVDDTLGALPCGTYTITELAGENNAGKKLVTGTITISKDGYTVNLGTIQNKTISITTTALEEDTDSHYAFAGDNVTILDTVSYYNTYTDAEQFIVGVLMNAETGEPVTDENGSAVTSVYYFTPTAEDGSVTLEYTFDASEFAGADVVVFAYLYLVTDEGSELLASHTDLSDEGQTIHFPSIQTVALDSETKAQVALADEEVTVIDTVAYTNLETGKKYTLTGYVYDQATGEILTVDGEEITRTITFIPEESDGTVEMTFTFDASELAGTTLVVFEELSRSGYIYAFEMDLTEADQTVYLPEIETTALDSVTDDHISLAGEVTITDTVVYDSLLPGKEYTVSGVLYDKETGEPLLVDGEEITASTTFTPETASGSVEILFTFDASALAGTTIVAFETVQYKGIDVAVHAEIEDEKQTVYIPELITSAVDSETGIQNSLADEEITIIDTVSYTDVLPGVTYMVSGILYDKATGEPLLIDGKTVTGSAEFTAESTSGTVEVTYTFDGTGLEDTTLVVYESLYYLGELVAVHEDIDDEAQTIYIPEIGTTAEDSVTDDHVALAGEITIIDTVTYSNLIPGKTYTVNGILYNQETGEPLLVDGGEVTGSTTFTAETASGTVEVSFTFDASALEGTTVVAFEDIEYDNIKVAVHAEINDKPQSVYIPEITTSAVDAETGIRNSLADGEVTIIDTVAYNHVLTGVQYTVTGVLYNQTTGEPLLIDGEQVTGTASFTAEESEGTVEVTYTFDGTGLENTTLVVYEYLYFGENIVAVHAEIDDEAQTVYIPEIGTTAVDEETGTHNALADGEVTIIDTVTYTNLLVGKEYTVTGILYDKNTGEPLLVDGEQVTASTTFTTASAAGSVKLTYTFDASGLAGTAVVVFEDLYYEGILIASHADIGDEDQTVWLETPESEKEEEEEGGAVKTGDGTALILWMGAVATALGAAFVLGFGRKKFGR